MKLEICEKCKHFIQHYVLSNYFGITKTCDGHCEYKQNLKNKTTCEKFEEENKSNQDKQINILKELHRIEINLHSIANKLILIKKQLTELKNEKKHK